MKKAIIISATLVGITVAGATAAFAANSTTTTNLVKGFGHKTMSGMTASGREMPKFEQFAFSGITDAEKATLQSLRDAQKTERDAAEKLSDTDKAELKTLRDAQQKEMQHFVKLNKQQPVHF